MSDAVPAAVSLLLAAGAGLFAVGCGEDPAGANGSAGAEDTTNAVDASDDASDDVSTDTADATTSAPIDFDAPGRFRTGHRTVTATDAARQRTLTIELWYPAGLAADTPLKPGKLGEFAATPAQQTALATALAGAVTTCTSAATVANRDAPASGTGKLAVVAFSHCHTCTRFSSFSVAERLASHGMLVVAPDHAGNTLFDDLAGAPGKLDKAMLATRAADIRFALDVVLDKDNKALPDDLRGRGDVNRVGVMGHSFGSVTAGLVAQTDARIKAVVGLAAPMQNPLLPGVEIAKIKLPLMLMLMREDNSITEFGNKLIRDNFTAAPGPAYKVELDDAGHWSVSDLCGLRDAFMPGCGAATRQTDGEPFVYRPVSEGLAIASRWVGAFFFAHLQGDPPATALLQGPAKRAGVFAEHKAAHP